MIIILTLHLHSRVVTSSWHPQETSPRNAAHKYRHFKKNKIRNICIYETPSNLFLILGSATTEAAKKVDNDIQQALALLLWGCLVLLLLMWCPMCPPSCSSI